MLAGLTADIDLLPTLRVRGAITPPVHTSSCSIKNRNVITKVITPCNLVGIYKRFEVKYCLHFFYLEDGSIVFLWNVSSYYVEA
jgi:hypothetical protein